MDYFSYNRRRGNSASDQRRNAPLPPTPAPQTPGVQAQAGQPQGGRTLGGPASLESLRAPSSIRIRRLPSGLSSPRPETQHGPQQGAPPASQEGTTTGRRRSSSEPQRFGSTLAPPQMDLSRQRTAEMPTITEGQSPTPGPQPTDSSQSFYEAAETPRPQTPSINIDESGSPAERVMTGASAMQEAGNAARSNRGLQRFRTGGSAMPRNENPSADEYQSDVVDLLDLVGKFDTQWLRMKIVAY